MARKKRTRSTTIKIEGEEHVVHYRRQNGLERLQKAGQIIHHQADIFAAQQESAQLQRSFNDELGPAAEGETVDQGARTERMTELLLRMNTLADRGAASVIELIHFIASYVVDVDGAEFERPNGDVVLWRQMSKEEREWFISDEWGAFAPLIGYIRGEEDVEPAGKPESQDAPDAPKTLQ